MLTERGFAIVDTRFCMYFFFRFLFKYWSRFPWWPRILIHGLALLDIALPLGSPMDLMILAQRVPVAAYSFAETTYSTKEV